VGVTCLLNPGKKLTFCSIENSVSITNILDFSGDQLFRNAQHWPFVELILMFKGSVNIIIMKKGLNT